jgi:hypothetical protein
MNPKCYGLTHVIDLCRSRYISTVAGLATVLVGLQSAQAQWQSQSFVIKPGWNAIYLHVDPSYTNLDNLIGGDPSNPISEVWMWVPTASTIQYVTSPQAPINGSSQWSSWVRNGAGLGTTLSSMIPNAGYLIHSLAASNYTWTIKGKPVAPHYTWTTTGINLIGFPTRPATPPLLDNFLSFSPVFQSVADIYQYVGGSLGPANPAPVFAPHTVTVNRGKAFWIRSGSFFNNYFGPFQVGVGGDGVIFGDSGSQISFHLINTTPGTVTVLLTLIPSETPPPGQTPIAGLPPLVVRGALDPTNLTYSVSNLTTSGTLSWTLTPQGQPGSDIVISLGVNRTVFTGNSTGLYAGILKFTDSYNLTEVDVPVSAQPSSYAGLWVGSASISQVANYLKIYQRDQNNNPVLGPNGAYVVTGINTNIGPVSTPFPLRLILHNDGNKAVLLQRVYYGSDSYSNTVVTTSESLLNSAQLGNARRITAVQLPFTAGNQPWQFSGQLIPGGILTTTVDLPYDDQASNPFLHTYHPDHDNLDASFQRELPVGSESYEINRQITLAVNPAGTDFASLTQFGQAFQGTYNETITMTGLNAATRTFNVAGSFGMTRISPVAVLTQPPPSPSHASPPAFKNLTAQ